MWHPPTPSDLACLKGLKTWIHYHLLTRNCLHFADVLHQAERRPRLCDTPRAATAPAGDMPRAATAPAGDMPRAATAPAGDTPRAATAPSLQFQCQDRPILQNEVRVNLYVYIIFIINVTFLFCRCCCR